jgi:hypothetical protein
MFGIGLDDAFIIFGEYSRTNKERTPVQRIHDTFEEVGLSIVLTKVTTTLAFALGCYSDIPTLYWLSFYAFPMVVIDFVYQLTFFVALLVLDEQRIKANRRDCCFCFKASSRPRMNSTDSSSYMSEDATSETTSSSPQPNKESKEMQGSKSGINEPQSRVDRFMGCLAERLLRPWVKIFVVLTFLALTVGCFYSTSLFTQEFNLLEMLPSDSFIKDYMAAMEMHGARGFIIPSAYFRNVNQSNPVIQDAMDSYINDLVSMNSVTEQPPFFWLRHFRDFLTYDDRLLDLTFNQQMDIFLSISHFKTLYGDHIIRDPDSGDIIASRCVLYMDNVDLKTVDNQIQSWRDQLDITRMQPTNLGHGDGGGNGFNFFLYEESMLFVWEFYAETVDELIWTTILGVVTVCLIGFVFIPHWTAMLFLFPIISALYIDLIGT